MVVELVGDDLRIDVHQRAQPHAPHYNADDLWDHEQQVGAGHFTIERDAHIHQQRHQARDETRQQTVFPVALDRIDKIRPDESMLVARPVARDIGHARRKRTCERQARHQEQQRLDDHGAHALGVALRQPRQGLRGDFAGLQLHLRVGQVGQTRIPQ